MERVDPGQKKKKDFVHLRRIDRSFQSEQTSLRTIQIYFGENLLVHETLMDCPVRNFL